MNKQVNTITKANGSKDTNEVTKYSTEDESTILTLERAKGLAEYISKNNAFAAQFGEKDENGNVIINVPAIVTCLMLGSEMGLKPMEALQFGRMLNRLSVIKVRKGKTLGLDPITAMQNIYIWDSGKNEIIYTGINIVLKVLNENNIAVDVIEDGNKIHYYYRLLRNGKLDEEVEFDERDEFLNNKYTVVNDGKSATKLKADIDAGKIMLQRFSTRRALVKLTRINSNGKESVVAIPYTLREAIEAGYYPGINSFGEEVKGKDNWISHTAAMLRKMSIMIGARIIANDKLNGIYETDEIGSVKVYTNAEAFKFKDAVVENVVAEDITDVTNNIENSTNNDN